MGKNMCLVGMLRRILLILVVHKYASFVCYVAPFITNILILHPLYITSMSHVHVLLENRPHLPLRSLCFARFLSTGGRKSALALFWVLVLGGGGALCCIAAALHGLGHQCRRETVRSAGSLRTATVMKGIGALYNNPGGDLGSR